MAKRFTALFTKSKKLAAGMYCDGAGLYLNVRGSGSRSWIFRYRERATGRHRDLGLGSAGEGGVSLEDARERAGELRAALRRGIDPATERAKEKEATSHGSTFGEFADAFLKSIAPGFKNRKSEVGWKRDLEVRCKKLRSKQLTEITTSDVLEVLSPLWMTLHRSARETRERIERVLDAAEAKGLRSGKNPAQWKGNLRELLPKVKRKKRHHPAAPYKDMPEIVRALREKHATADTDVNRAAEFVILTAVRTSEARFMRVREIDFEARLWTVPESRMKLDDQHEVPLCDRAIAILKAVIPKDAKPDDWVFTGQWGKPKPLGMNAVNHALKAIYSGPVTTHGCRSTFRDWAGDETNFPREIAEMALAHKVGNEVELAYRRSNALEKRRKLMDAWGRYLDGGAKVVRLVHAQ